MQIFYIIAIILFILIFFVSSKLSKIILLSAAIICFVYGSYLNNVENFVIAKTNTACSNVECEKDNLEVLPVNKQNELQIFDDANYNYTKYRKLNESDYNTIIKIFPSLSGPISQLLNSVLENLKFKPLPDYDSIEISILVTDPSTGQNNLSIKNIQFDSNYCCENGIYANDNYTILDIGLQLNITFKSLICNLNIDNANNVTSTSQLFKVDIDGITTLKVGLTLQDNTLSLNKIVLTDTTYNSLNIISDDPSNRILFRGIFLYFNDMASYLNNLFSNELSSLAKTLKIDVDPTLLQTIKDIFGDQLKNVPDNYSGLTVPPQILEYDVGFFDFQSCFITKVFYNLEFIMVNSSAVLDFSDICANPPVQMPGCGPDVNPTYNFDECCKGSQNGIIDLSCRSDSATFTVVELDINRTLNKYLNMNMFAVASNILLDVIFRGKSFSCAAENRIFTPCSPGVGSCVWPKDGHNCGDFNTYPWECLPCWNDQYPTSFSLCEIDLTSLVNDGSFQLIGVVPETKYDGSTVSFVQNSLSYAFSFYSAGDPSKNSVISIGASMKGHQITSILNFNAPEGSKYDPDTFYYDTLRIQIPNLMLVAKNVSWVYDNASKTSKLSDDTEIDLTYDPWVILNFEDLKCSNTDGIIKKLWCQSLPYIADIIHRILNSTAVWTTLLTTYFLGTLVVLIPGGAVLFLVLTLLIAVIVLVIETGDLIVEIIETNPTVQAFVRIFLSPNKLIEHYIPQIIDRLKDKMVSLLKTISFPFQWKDTFAFQLEKDYNCSCKNICARNWDNLLQDPIQNKGWKNATCGQSFQIFASQGYDFDFSTALGASTQMLPCNNVLKVNDNQVSACFAVQNECVDPTASSCFQPNATSSPSESLCNAPLGYYVLDNNLGVSCDEFCQTKIGTISSDKRPPNTLASYCLNAKDDSGNIVPCVEAKDNLTCFCSQNNSLYTPYSSMDDSNRNRILYGEGTLPLLASTVGVYIINLKNNKYLVNYQIQDADGNIANIVDGLTVTNDFQITGNNVDRVNFFYNTSLVKNIYGQKSIWKFFKVSDSEPIYNIQSAVDGNFLYETNEPLSFDIMNSTDPDSYYTFNKFTVKPKADDDKDTRFQWKIVYTYVRQIAIVSVYSNRSILGVEPSEIEKMFNLVNNSSDDNDATVEGLVTAFDCYNKYQGTNTWYAINASFLPLSRFNRTLNANVYNIYNVASWSSFSVQNNLQLFADDGENIMMINGVNYTFPKGPLLLPFPYPADNSNSSSQWFVQKQNDNSFTIQTLGIENDIQYLYEMEQDSCSTPYGPNNDCMNVGIKKVDNNQEIPDDAKWNIPILDNNKTFGYNVIQAKSGRYLAQSEYSPATNQDYLKQLIENLSKGVSLFYTVETDITVINKHYVAWSFLPTPPQVNPTSFQRTNIFCPTETSMEKCNDNDSTALLCSSFPKEKLYTNDAPDINLSRTNLSILSNTTDTDGCIVDFPSVLKNYTPDNAPSDKPWPDTVDDMVANNQIPTLVPMSQPCKRYGDYSNFNLEGTPKQGFQLTNTSPIGTRNIVYDDDLVVFGSSESVDDPKKMMWNIIPSQSSEGSFTCKNSFLTITNFLETDKTYYLLNWLGAAANLLTFNVASSSPNFLSFSFSSDNDNTDGICRDDFPNEVDILSQLTYEKDETNNRNYLCFKNKASQKYIGCNLEAVMNNWNNYKIGKYIPLQFYDKSDDVLDYISFNFVLVKDEISSPTDLSYNYSYTIRTEKYYANPDGGYFCGYLYIALTYDPTTGKNVNTPFILLQSCSDSPFNYLPNDSFFEDTLKENTTFVRFTFNHINEISGYGCPDLLYNIQSQYDTSKCISRSENKFGGDNQTSLNYFGIETCNSSALNQQFSFQPTNYQPSDYPYINFKSDGTSKSFLLRKTKI